MNTVVIVSMVAGGSSLAAGIISLMMRGLRGEMPVREPRDSRKAELRALEKEINSSMAYSRRKLQRFRWIVATATVYFMLGGAIMLIPSTNGHVGPISSEVLHFAASVVAARGVAMLVISATQAYIMIRRDQQHIEQKMAQLEKGQIERKPQLAGRR